jgi:uncharacterized protein YdeI (YjbR/CyaY-like superfamily)
MLLSKCAPSILISFLCTTHSTKMTTILDFPTHTFPTPSSFSTFLAEHHAALPGIYLRLAKKASGIPSITAAEAVEVALCYGWIDGRANTVDDNWWTVRYTPRRAKSIWSQKNVATVARLVEEGRMMPAGLEAVESAKADGRWERAYAGSVSGGVPEDFEEKLRENKAAERVWEGMNKSEKYKVVMQLVGGAEKNRERKIEAVVRGLAEGKAKSTKRTVKSTKKAKIERNSADRDTKDVIRRIRTSDTGAGIQKNSRPKREGLRSG